MSDFDSNVPNLSSTSSHYKVSNLGRLLRPLISNLGLFIEENFNFQSLIENDTCGYIAICLVQIGNIFDSRRGMSPQEQVQLSAIQYV